MAVDIIWSSTDGGSAIVEPLAHGSGSAGNILTAQEIFIRHNGTNQIQGCKFHIAEGDVAELLEWGNAVEVNAFGGLQINMDAIHSYTGAWPTFGTPNPTYSRTFRTGTGDNSTNGVTLMKEMSAAMSQDGIIPPNCSPNPAFKARIVIPVNEDHLGSRSFSQKLRFTYTS